MLKQFTASVVISIAIAGTVQADGFFAGIVPCLTENIAAAESASPPTARLWWVGVGLRLSAGR